MGKFFFKMYYFDWNFPVISAAQAANSSKPGTVCPYSLDSTWQEKSLILALSVAITVKTRCYWQKNVGMELLSGSHQQWINIDLQGAVFMKPLFVPEMQFLISLEGDCVCMCETTKAHGSDDPFGIQDKLSKHCHLL